MRRRVGVASVLRLHRRHGIGQHPNGIVKAPLGLIHKRFVIDHFQAAGGVLFGEKRLLFGFVELVELAVDLGKLQIVVGIVRLRHRPAF